MSAHLGGGDGGASDRPERRRVRRCGAIPLRRRGRDHRGRGGGTAGRRRGEGRLGLAPGPLLVFDTGGGGSQFTFGEGGTSSQRSRAHRLRSATGSCETGCSSSGSGG